MRNKQTTVIDQLEPRRMMALITATMAGDVLLLKGTNGAETVTLTVDGDNLVVAGQAAPSGEYYGGLTTVNGKASVSFPKWSVKSVYATLYAGNDKLTVTAIDTGLVATLDTGTDDDAIVVNNSLMHGVSIYSGKGSDVVNVNNTTLQSLSVSTSDGDDKVYVTSVLNYDFASYNLGDGNDTLLTANGYTYGFTYVNMGAQADLFTSTGDFMFGGYYVTASELTYVS